MTDELAGLGELANAEIGDTGITVAALVRAVRQGRGDRTQGNDGNDGDGDQDGDGDVPVLDLTDPATQALLNALLGGGGDGGDGGGSSGGGGGPPPDPTIGAAASFYFQLWGERPPMNYIEGFIKQGHDLFDFMSWQLSRPGAAKQQFYRDEFSRYAAVAARTFGKR